MLHRSKGETEVENFFLTSKEITDVQNGLPRNRTDAFKRAFKYEFQLFKKQYGTILHFIKNDLGWYFRVRGTTPGKPVEFTEKVKQLSITFKTS